MKRLVLCLLSIVSFVPLHSTDQDKEIIELYNQLPEKLFFKSDNEGIFYIRPGNTLGSLSSFKNFIISPIILNALKNNEGRSGENAINISHISRDDLYAFINFVKNLEQGDIAQAYKATFNEDKKGFQVLRKLKVPEKIITLIEGNLSQELINAQILKRKREPESETSTKKTHTNLPLIHIKRQGSDKFITLTNDQVSVLQKLEDSLIKNTIESNPEQSILYIELPTKDFEAFSLPHIENFFKVASKFYSKPTTNTDDFVTLVSELVTKLNLHNAAGIKSFIKHWTNLSDYLGYDELSKMFNQLLQELDAFFESDIPSNLTEINAKAAKWPTLVIINELIKKNIITQENAKNLPVFITKIKKLLLLTELAGFESINTALVELLILVENIESYLEKKDAQSVQSLIGSIKSLSSGIQPIQMQTIISPERQVLPVLVRLFKENAEIAEIFKIFWESDIFKKN